MPLRIVGADGSTQGIRVTIDVFRGAGERKGGAELKRPLHQCGGKCVVDHDGDPERLGDRTDRLKVDHFEQGIGGTLQPHHGRLAVVDGIQRIGSGEINPLRAKPKFGEDLLEQAHRAAIKVLLAQHQITMFQLGNHRCDRTHPRGEHGGVVAAFH